MSLVNGVVNDMLRKAIGGDHQAAFLQARVVAECPSRFILATEQDEGVAVVAACHRDFSVGIPEVGTRSLENHGTAG